MRYAIAKNTDILNIVLTTALAIGASYFIYYLFSSNQKNKNFVKNSVIDVAESIEAQQALSKILTIPAVREIINNLFRDFNKLPKVIGLDENQALRKCPFGARWECRLSIKDGHIFDMDEPTIYFNRGYPSSLHPYLILFELINLTHVREYVQQDIDFKLEKLSKQSLVTESNKIEKTVGLAAHNILNSAKRVGKYNDDGISIYCPIIYEEYRKRHPRCSSTFDFFKHHAEKAVNDTTKTCQDFHVHC